MKNLLANEYYRFIFGNSSDAILLTQLDGSIHHVNPATCKMLCRTCKEICKLGRNGIVDLNDPRLEKALQERSSNGRVRSELNFIRADGIKIPVDITSSVFKDHNDVQWTVMIVRDMTIYKQLEDSFKMSHEQALQLATVDYLTGIINRRGFMERLQNEIEHSKREGIEKCLIIIDLDHFKQINDIYGHLAGDFVLKQFADCLKQNLRPYDILARFGGDEFIICLPGISLQEAAVVAERLRCITDQLQITHHSQPIKLTASFGVTAYNIDLQEDIDTFISRADDAMYKAKRTKDSVFVNA